MSQLLHSGVLISSVVHNICLDIFFPIVQRNSLNNHQPLPVLSSETAHYSASDDCWWSILWLRAEWKKASQSAVCWAENQLDNVTPNIPGFYEKITVQADKRESGERDRGACECRKTQAAIHVNGWEGSFISPNRRAAEYSRGGMWSEEVTEETVSHQFLWLRHKDGACQSVSTGAVQGYLCWADLNALKHQSLTCCRSKCSSNLCSNTFFSPNSPRSMKCTMKRKLLRLPLKTQKCQLTAEGHRKRRQW